MTPVGFPHSDISGSKPACGSPKLFAANHVLHRLSTPRHPPCALSSLTIIERATTLGHSKNLATDRIASTAPRRQRRMRARPMNQLHQLTRYAVVKDLLGTAAALPAG